MYFKVTRKILKKALVWLKKTLAKETTPKDVLLRNYIDQVEFALYKTKLNEFYIDYEFAKVIRPALLTKEIKK